MRTDREYVSLIIRKLVQKDTHYLEMVWAINEFNLVFDVEPNPELYANLVIEEVNEWQEELLMHGWTENLLKETADILYVLEGLLNANVDEQLQISEETDERLDEALTLVLNIIIPFCHHYYTPNTILLAFKETHRSNLSKLGEDGKPIRRKSDNKVLKGPNYTPADMSDLVFGKQEIIDIYEV